MFPSTDYTQRFPKCFKDSKGIPGNTVSVQAHRVSIKHPPITHAILDIRTHFIGTGNAGQLDTGVITTLLKYCQRINGSLFNISSAGQHLLHSRTALSARLSLSPCVTLEPKISIPEVRVFSKDPAVSNIGSNKV